MWEIMEVALFVTHLNKENQQLRIMGEWKAARMAAAQGRESTRLGHCV